MSELDFFMKNDARTAIERVEKLLDCGIFQQKNSSHVLFQAAFIELLIALRDLMCKTEKYSSRIVFDDDVKKTERIKDVTDLIKYVRDALCHPDSDNHYIEAGNIKATFNVVFGQGSLLKIDGFEQSSLYKDDICFFFGSQGIYLKRHIVRAFHEAKSKLHPIFAESV